MMLFRSAAQRLALSFALLVLIVSASNLAAARSLDPQECPADTKRLEYSDIVLCWPNAEDAVEFKFESPGMLLGSQYWVGRRPASSAEIAARARDKKGLPTLAMLQLVPRDHPIVGTDYRASLAAQIKKALDSRGNETEVTVAVFVSNSVGERELRFHETERHLLTAAIPITDGAVAWELEAWASLKDDGTIDYVMTCSVPKGMRSCSSYFPLAHLLATINVNFAEDADQARHIIELMRAQLRAYVVSPKLNAP